jgi:hypothetical protein
VAHLLVAAAQILYLDHRRAPIAVDVAVSQIDALRGRAWRVLPMRFCAGWLLVSLSTAPTRCAELSRLATRAHHIGRGRGESERLLGIDTNRAPAPHDVAGAANASFARLAAQAASGRFSPPRARSKDWGSRRLAGYAEEISSFRRGAQLMRCVAASPANACSTPVPDAAKRRPLAEQVAPNGGVCATDLHPETQRSEMS